MNWRATYIAAQLAAAAYAETLVQAVLGFNALGYAMLGHYLNADHQAFLLHNADGYTLAISGTRFGRSLGDLLDDADIVPVDLGDGVQVAKGPYNGMGAMWVWVQSLTHATPDADFAVCGHSLGGERTLLTELFLPATRIRALYAFEAPKCGNDLLWRKLAQSMGKTTTVINGQDLWAGWPLVSTWEHPPMPHVHLNGATWGWVGPAEWPAAVSPDDHSISMVVDRLGKIADAMPAM